MGSSPFARHYWGNHFLFSLPAGTKMFQFPAFASVLDGCHPFRMTGCPIRKSAHHRLFAPTRDFSQLITSFIACKSQGIRRTPFPTFFFRPYNLRHTLIYTFSCMFLHIRQSLICFSSCLSICQRSLCSVYSFESYGTEWRITDSNR